MGVDLLRKHLGTLAVQSRRKRLARNVTPHPCIVAHRLSGRKDIGEPARGNLDEDATPEAVASGRGGGTLGFTGAAANDGSTRPAGLRTLAGAGFGNGPTLPMLPSGCVDD